MSEDTQKPEPLTEEEIAAQKGEPLPDREAMSLIDPSFNKLPPMPLGAPTDQVPPDVQ